MLKENIKQYLLLMRLDKPIGIFLLLWPTLWALWLASKGKPDLLVLTIFIAGVILMRSTGCIINDYADRHIDKYVARTKVRPLATGRISTSKALFLFCVLCFISFMLVLLLNTYTILLSFIGVALAIIYPFLKRYTHLPQIGLGFAFSWGVPMAFAAEKNAIPLAAWLLYFTAVIWAVIYDTMYAMTDKKDDLSIGVKSTAILFGAADKKIIAFLQVLFLFLLACVGYLFHLKSFYYISLILSAGFFVYQQNLIKNRDPQACFKAFLNNHWVGFIIFIGIVASYLK